MKFVSEAKAGRTRLSTKDARSAYPIPDAKLGRPYKDDWDIDRAIDQAMKKVIPVFRGVHVIADNQARLPFAVRQGSEEGPFIEGHDLVRILNQKPNPDENPYVFRYRLSAQVLLSRKGAFVEIVRNRLGGIQWLYLLDPRKTNPVPSKKIKTRAPVGKDVPLIDHFEVDLGQGETEKLDPDRVIWIRLPHPVDPLAGMTPLEAAGLAIDIDVLARLYNRNFLRNDGRPGGILGVKGEMDDDVADELDDRVNPAYSASNIGRVLVLEADGLSWVDTAITPRDAQYVEALANTKVDILGAFGVPESMAYGNASQRTYDNVDAERFIFWESTELGHLALLGDGLNQADGDETTFSDFDTSGVDVLQRTEERKRDEMRTEVKDGVRTLDSYLEETGRDPVGSAEARSYYRQLGDVPYATDGEVAPILSLVQEAAKAGAKAALEELDRKAVRTPFRHAPGGA